MANASDVARWMVAGVVSRRTWYQADLLREFSAEFGDEWLHPGQTGRRAIDRLVRARFRAEHGGAISWDPLTRCWHVATPVLLSRLR